MTQDKELLLKDLCSRLPYGVKCYGYCFKIDGNHCECYGTLDSIKLGIWHPFHLSNRMSINNGATYDETFSEVKPYLFPLSSMTEEQRVDLTKFVANGIYNENIVYDWYNKNHFDYRGLIEKSLAIDATKLNVY